MAEKFEMTWNDTQALEALRVNINELVNERCREYNSSRSISYLDLCAMMVVGGYFGNHYHGEHNNVASVSNFLSIQYDKAVEILDNLVSYGYVQRNGNDNKLTDKGLEFTRRYVGDNLFNVFRQRMFNAINLTLYPKDNHPDINDYNEKIENYESMLNIEVGNNNCGKQLYEKILELPCVWMCYLKLQVPMKDGKVWSEAVFDIIGKPLVKKNTHKEISRIVENIVRKVIRLPENERLEYISEDDFGYLRRADFEYQTRINDNVIYPFKKSKHRCDIDGEEYEQ